MAKSTRPKPLRKYRVLYAVTRAEYYEIEAASEEESRRLAFENGKLAERCGITDCVPCDVWDIG